eukprot:CAMPEP_0115014566 /NCGR_PEP_ID=MMETSP0216-20121206/26170_1 /TAXON_ID=223996 /ORGANISM="Protocruzia adherens, Strain Boccale" /LENGTH=115 /DNA_ID=CAMNT_0002384361 /DNA_START=37 /DNA_END=384 /DNA_ORIENTATION=+
MSQGVELGDVRPQMDKYGDRYGDFGDTYSNEELPEIPKKPCYMAIFLFVMGILLIIGGFIEEIKYLDPSRGTTLWIIGGICLVPGSYYSYKFYKAWKTTNAIERRHILADIPQFD